MTLVEDGNEEWEGTSLDNEGAHKHQMEFIPRVGL